MKKYDVIVVVVVRVSCWRCYDTVELCALIVVDDGDNCVRMERMGGHRHVHRHDRDERGCCWWLNSVENNHCLWFSRLLYLRPRHYLFEEG